MKFRKKPVVIDAWRISLEAVEPEWVRTAFAADQIDWCPDGEGLYVNTLEGAGRAALGVHKLNATRCVSLNVRSVAFNSIMRRI